MFGNERTVGTQGIFEGAKFPPVAFRNKLLISRLDRAQLRYVRVTHTLFICASQ